MKHTLTLLTALLLAPLAGAMETQVLPQLPLPTAAEVAAAAGLPVPATNTHPTE